MIASLLSLWVTALVYATVVMTAAALAERAGWLRNTLIAETAWRIALWSGLLIAAASVLRAPVLDAWSWAQAQPVASSSIVPSSTRQVPATAPPSTQAPPSPRNSPITDTATKALPQSLAVLLLALLISATGVVLTGLLRAAWAQRKLLGRAEREGRPARAIWLAHRRDIAPSRDDLRLREIAFLGSPLAIGRRDVLLPEWCAELGADEQRALLAHECAHLERRDPLWRWLDAIAVLLLAGHPLARHAERRLHELSEWACDHESARRTGKPRALAQCLAECLEHLLPAPPAFAVAMAEPAHGVVVRVQRLLEDQPMATTPALAHFRRALIGMAIAAAFAVPAIAITVGAGKRHSNSIEISIADGLFGGNHMKANFTEPGRTLKIASEGTVQFSDDESRITGFVGKGEFEIVDTQAGLQRELRVAGSGTNIKLRYRVDGSEQAFDATGQQWLASTLPDMFRRTGMDAEARAARIHARGGVDALMTEIALIPSDYARATYISALFTLTKLDDAQLTRAIELASAIESDYELRRTLSTAIASGHLEDAAAVRVLQAAASIDSDFERAELLIAASTQIAVDETRLSAWQAAVSEIDSDFEKRRVLEGLLDRAPTSPQSMQLALSMAATIGSDFETRSLLQHALSTSADYPDLHRDYLKAVDVIDSDFERREALLTLIGDAEMDAATAIAILDAASAIGSDFEVKEVLTALAAVMPYDTEVLANFRAVARRLGSHERGEVEQALDRFAEV